MTNPPSDKKRIVILGGGFAGAYCMQHLARKLNPKHFEVTLIDQNNYFVFYPLLVEAGTGALEPRHTIVSIRSFVGRHSFLMARIDGIDFARKKVSCRIDATARDLTVDYDHLVIALGTVTRLPNIPGLNEHAFTMKSLSDAISIRDHIIRMLEAADASSFDDEQQKLLHVVVVGANFTGVEVAGDYHRFMHELAKKNYPRLNRSYIKVTLIEITDRILAALDEDLSYYAQSQLQKRGVSVITGTGVSKIEGEKIELSDASTIASRTVIWCAGIQPNPLLEKLASLPLDKSGYVETTPDLSVPGLDGVWAIGDIAVNRAPNGEVYPATAQHAVQLGKALAQSLVARLFSRTPPRIRIKNRGALAALGCRTGVAKVFGIKLSGFAAWFLWRTVYLLKMPGFARKLRVAFDWTADLIAKPEAVQLGSVRKSPSSDNSNKVAELKDG